MKKHYRHENDCLNCGTILEGKFCHNCGQENLQVKESFGHMMNHAISDYFHFDHQFFQTIKPLLFKPGFLTNEYLAGKRAKYLHPVKMYIFISVMYFLLFFKQGDPVHVNVHQDLTAIQLQEATGKINQNSLLSPKTKAEAIRNLYRSNGYLMVNNHPVKDTLKKSRKIIDEKEDRLISPTTSDTSYEQYLYSQSKLPEARRDGWFERYYNKKAFIITKQKIDLKELIGESSKHNFPKLMFLLLPLFALILSIAFRRNNKYYVEHLIYSIHLHSFLFLFLGIIAIVKLFIPSNWEMLNGLIGFAAFVSITLYLYQSLRTVYNRGPFRTITKLLGISLVYSFVSGICLALFYIVIAATAV